ncbi:MAG: class I SAM-dependent methyltransferase [bacterium]|nr:class I SAM-dependent methyltransferase [bacterium]
MPALQFVRDTLLNPRSPACAWRHPFMAGRLFGAALENAFLGVTTALATGGSRACPVCGWRGFRMRNFLSGDEVIRHCICPECGSFDRHRLLVQGVRKELAGRHGWSPSVMVGFSLSTAVRYVLEHEGLARCFRSDIDAGVHRFSPDFTADLRCAPLASDAVDWIFCSHVLEHIAELEDCVDELLRVLKPGGSAWIQVPFEPGLAHSHRIPIDPHRAHAHAWQFAPDFGLLLERPGWTVQEFIAEDVLPRADLHRYSVDPRERFWLATKDA